MSAAARQACRQQVARQLSRALVHAKMKRSAASWFRLAAVISTCLKRPSPRTIPPSAAARAGPTPAGQRPYRAGLVVGVALVYGQTLRYGFLGLDDATFVGDEPHVSGGCSWSGIIWAITRGPVGDWCPLAMLSHMLDCQLFGLNPAGHHFTNLLLHAASAVTLFLVLWRMTAGLWPSALVAAVFALHPLHVESVAWIAERRDVLSGLLFMLTLGAYGDCAAPESLVRYLAVMALLALGLMAKSMLVTLPPLLLLLDFWPLGRFRRLPADAGAKGPRPTAAWRLVVEKLPLVALASAATGVAVLSHRVTAPNPVLRLSERLATAAISYVAYLGQLLVPIDLSAFYAYPATGWPAWQVAAAVVLLLAITAAAVIWRRSYPYFFVGWFWYVGMLLPVVQIIPFGAHARADRYTYLAQIGLTIALVWGAMGLTATWPARRLILSVGSALVLGSLTACAWRQTGYWRNDETLWKHALACDPQGVMAHYQLALAWKQQDPRRRGGAMPLRDRADQRRPRFLFRHAGTGLRPARRPRRARGKPSRGTGPAPAGDHHLSRLCPGPPGAGIAAAEPAGLRPGSVPFPPLHRAGAGQSDDLVQPGPGAG